MSKRWFWLLSPRRQPGLGLSFQIDRLGLRSLSGVSRRILRLVALAYRSRNRRFDVFFEFAKFFDRQRIEFKFYHVALSEAGLIG